MTLGQLLHDALGRRDPEARPWDWLAPSQQQRCERAALTVAAAVQPEMEMLRARVADLEAKLDGVRAANAVLARQAVTS